MSESHPSWITMVRVPDFDSPEQMSYVKGRLATDFRTNASWTQWGKQTWQRLSAQIYLDRETIEEYGQRVLALQVEHQSLKEKALHAEVAGVCDCTPVPVAGSKALVCADAGGASPCDVACFAR